ncbi:MAG: PACE efflux transporter [Alphaproteobacteria bacterium]|nr:PACE efflux transporter [Alphaproteobacteria bacterium]
MRTTRDRIRHTLAFEIIGLALITPLGALTFSMPLHDIGVISLVSSLVAMGWNYVYNYGFDRLLLRLRGATKKSLPDRIVHAVLFELGLVLMLMPLIAWYLGISLWQALFMDIAFALFYMVYAFGFNLAYDRIFPALADADPRERPAS